ncbi:MAG: STAS domain-containing protein [Phototrophicaceae bacterium]
MSLQVQEYNIRIVVVTPAQRIDTFNAAEIRGELMKYIEEDVKRLVIDLSEVPFLDSAGMAVLVSTLKRARSVGGDVKLVWPKVDAAKRVLTLTKFDKVFTIVETVNDAIQGLWAY